MITYNILSDMTLAASAGIETGPLISDFNTFYQFK